MIPSHFRGHIPDRPKNPLVKELGPRILVSRIKDPGDALPGLEVILIPRSEGPMGGLENVGGFEHEGHGAIGHASRLEIGICGSLDGGSIRAMRSTDIVKADEREKDEENG